MIQVLNANHLLYKTQESNPFVKITEEDLLDDKTLQKKLRIAAQMGIFYLEIPHCHKQAINQAVDFANTFYQIEEIKELQLEGFSGYQARDYSQVEAFYVERKYWEKILPISLNHLAINIYELALKILKNTLSALEIDEDHHSKISGKVTDKKGDIFFTFNHYNPEKPFEGLGEHRDFGQMTVLFANQCGLQAKIDENWIDVPSLEGYFIVNFGKALENSINNSEQLVAVWHRVKKVSQDRISFVLALGNSADSLIYKKNANNQIIDTGESYLSILQASKRYRPISQEKYP